MTVPPRQCLAIALRRGAAPTLIVGGATLIAGCGPQSIVDTHSPQAHNIALLWWWMLAAAVIVFLGAVALLVVAYVRRGVAGLPFVGEREGIAQGMVLVFGIGVPAVALVALFGVSDVFLIGQTAPPAPRTTKMTIEVIGHQWWWEVRYPRKLDDSGAAQSGEAGGRAGGMSEAVTANEIHIPARTRVNVVATTADVIHSFWVPGLNRKIDMVPGRQNRVLLYASSPGTYRGQCSQFCGLQHAHMAMYVVAQRPAAYRAWLANMAASAATPTTAAVQAGRQQFFNDGCSSCHMIRGTSAAGLIGPDLTHLASRMTLASAEIPNRPAWLAAWIRNPQAIKPGDRMPDLGLSNTQVNSLVTYLDRLH